MSYLKQGNLLPFRQIPEAEVINWYSLNGTGQNGMFVALETGNQSPLDGDGYIPGSSVGASYTNIVSPRYEVKRKVRAVASGDTKFNSLGVTLHTVAEFDENGRKLILLDKDARDERGYCLSGEAVPVATRGVITLKSVQYVGIPIPGYVGVAGTGSTEVGKIVAINPALLNVGTVMNTGMGYSHSHVLGKFVSSSGIGFGGYAQFKLEL